MSTQVIRLNPRNTERMKNAKGEYDDVNDIISKLFDAYDEVHT